MNLYAGFLTETEWEVIKVWNHKTILALEYQGEDGKPVRLKDPMGVDCH